jgi:single-strand DNA-binding protein
MNSTSFVGNLTADPKLVFPDGGGTPRATFSVAVNEGQGETEKTHYINVTAFGTLAENLEDSLSKGQRVLVIGRFNTYSKDVTIKGEDKSLTMLSITASAVGPDLRWATAKVTKVVTEGVKAKTNTEAGDTPAPAAAKKQTAASENDDF